MVDGRRADGLVKPGLGHTANTLAAIDFNDAVFIGQKRHICDDGQAVRGVNIVSSVFANGAYGAGVNLLTVDWRDLNNDAFRCTQADRFRGFAGEKQSRRTGGTECRACARCVAAAQ